MQENNIETLKLFKRLLKLMGNRFEISVVHTNEAFANEAIDAAIVEIQRIEKLLTTFNENSQTQLINRNAGIKPVKVDQEMLGLIARSNKISELTQGAFDITYGSIDKSLWNFDTSITALPDKETAQTMVRLINYKNIVLNEEEGTVFLKEKGMRIGFGGIGKGYAADRAMKVLKGIGIESGVVNAAGDLIAWGHQPNGNHWTVGIANPDNRHHIFSQLNISNRAVATSGDYEKYVLINGKKYSHTIDPKSGYPVTGIKSITVIAPAAELADALATPVMVMGIKAGLYMMNQLKQVACIVIDDQNHIYTTNNIKTTV